MIKKLENKTSTNYCSSQLAKKYRKYIKVTLL